MQNNFSGRRVCPGEQLARLKAFIFTVALLQHFDFSVENEEQLSCNDGKVGVIHSPPLHVFKAICKAL